ncbi:ParB/RepB/Spo0J family partition protein [Mitsuokella sp. AF21-1AC]|uniref:ParB/RepB/Spo0J family partition protein n=1 Tax=Mitsuokella sp. AF21-1AC TaxID=2292235 RepID=UPI000E4FB4C5|nr:ParB/RepB/Spo0J family partition protein [Mitsuokella sp. AF21-1AC]RGS73524.1 ParB/RepB/Spo0J family partition protein [Mitsuokella sp. AF21-1AC]
MASKGHGGLGKGLGALLKDRKITPARDQVQEIPAADIQANRYQPRQEFDEGALEELRASIQHYGILQPLIVRRLTEHGYELIAGERRLRAARLAGLVKVPALVREYNDAEVSEIALIENIQRENLNAIEEARAYERLMQDFHLTQEVIAQKIGRSRSHVANFLRLLRLAPDIQDDVASGDLSMGQAKPLLALDDMDLQRQAAAFIREHGSSARQAEELVHKLLENPAYLQSLSGAKVEQAANDGQSGRNPDAFLEAAANRLVEALGTSVHIRPGRKKSRIEIEFYSEDDLERLLELLTRQENPPAPSAGGPKDFVV